MLRRTPLIVSEWRLFRFLRRRARTWKAAAKKADKRGDLLSRRVSELEPALEDMTRMAELRQVEIDCLKRTIDLQEATIERYLAKEEAEAAIDAARKARAGMDSLNSMVSRRDDYDDER